MPLFPSGAMRVTFLVTPSLRALPWGATRIRVTLVTFPCVHCLEVDPVASEPLTIAAKLVVAEAAMEAMTRQRDRVT